MRLSIGVVLAITSTVQLDAEQLACVANRHAGVETVGAAVQWACTQASGLACANIPASCNDTYSTADWVFSTYYLWATTAQTTGEPASTTLTQQATTLASTSTNTGEVTSTTTTEVDHSASTTSTGSTTTPLEVESDCCCVAEAASICYESVLWAMQTGIHQRPDWYPGLNASNGFVDFQQVFFEQGYHECVAPCDEPTTTTIPDSSVGACHFAGAALLQNISVNDSAGHTCINTELEDTIEEDTESTPQSTEQESTTATTIVTTTTVEPTTTQTTQAVPTTTTAELVTTTTILETTATATTTVVAEIHGAVILEASLNEADTAESGQQFNPLSFIEDPNVDMAVLQSLAETLGYPDIQSMIETEFVLIATDTGAPPQRRLEAGERVMANYTIRLDANLYRELQALIRSLTQATPTEMTSRVRAALEAIPGAADYLITVLELLEPYVILISANGEQLPVSAATLSKWSVYTVLIGFGATLLAGITTHN